MQPVPNAKVVISAWNFQLGPYDRHPTKFLVTTNADGRFALSRNFEFVIWQVTIEAMSPDGKYCSLGSSSEIDILFTHKPSARLGEERFFYFPGKGNFEMKLYELSDDEKHYTFYQYDTFTGGLGGDPEIVTQ
jgi:hypothetical protein